MSTNDVPGANPANGDSLKIGCWAEHSDGSLIFVQSTEGNRVIYSIFDMSKKPPIEYRDAMPTVGFNTTFSWKKAADRGLNEKWTWHDKTPFPWDRIIKQGFSDGSKSPAAEHVLNEAQSIMESRKRLTEAPAPAPAPAPSTAAQRVADALILEGRELDRRDAETRMERAIAGLERTLSRVGGIMSNLTKAVARLEGPKSSKNKNKSTGARR